MTAIPIIIAKRGWFEVLDSDIKKDIIFDFKINSSNTPEQYLKLVINSGIKELLIGGHISHLKDYVTGVEVGLDSNARKNRSGKLMEKIVEKFLRTNKYNYLSQVRKNDIKKKWNISYLENLNIEEGINQADKVFDFAVNVNNELFLIETNFYSSGGSKLNEVSRSYEKLSDDINKLPNCHFIWITDGQGWKTARNNLHESYMHQENLLTLADFDQLKEFLDSYKGPN